MSSTAIPLQKARQPVRLLPPELVNRIAAGEVVERPASVVKELVENALDAGASRVEVFASAGGRNLRVADNGCGMSFQDVELAFINHATSKITQADDLDHIDTLGFRGEALASILAISRVTCLTRTAEAENGLKVTFNETKAPSILPAGCAVGTVMEVVDLFYNTPARLKFLRKAQTELGHIEETVQNLALSHPDVRFSLTLNDKPTLATSGQGQLSSLVSEVLGLKPETLTHWLPVEQTEPDLKLRISGLLAPPTELKSSKRWLVTFVNNRSVRCPILSKAIEAAFESLLPSGKYPMCVLFIDLPTDEVDVNVHPTKKEVRYVQPNRVFGFVRQAVLETLQASGQWVYRTPEDAPGRGEAFGTGFTSAAAVMAGRPLASGASGAFAPSIFSSGPLVFEHSMQLQAPLTQPPQAVPEMTAEASESANTGITAVSAQRVKVIGQLFYTYILLETPQGLMVVDQHIASERTFFERLKQVTLAETPPTQHQLTGTPQDVTPAQKALLTEAEALFAQLGFYYTLPKDDRTVLLTGVPLFYAERQPVDLFERALKQLEETGQAQLDVDHLIATLACHSAVRAGDVLTHPEMERVIAGWLACQLPWTCPHGRPIAHTIRNEELQRFFHRPSMPVNAF